MSHDDELIDESHAEDYAEGPHRVAWYDRTRLRWVNALGFAVGFLLLIWVLLFLFGLLTAKGSMPLPIGFSVLLFAALAASIVLLAMVMSFAWRGMNLGASKPRLYLFLWSVASLLYFLVQAAVLFKFGRRMLPGPAFASELFWTLCPVGVITFLALTYVNSDLPEREASCAGWSTTTTP